MNKLQYVKLMERRQFLKMASMGALGAAALAACSSGDADVDEAAADTSLPELEWDLATSWPPILDTIFGGAERFADRVAALSGGKFMITAQPGGEVVPALEILQNIETDSIDSGHTASYYYTGLDPATAFGTALPFGLTARQQNAWLYEGGGLDMLQAFYADKFNAIQFPAGNTGAQMGGWFNKEIRSTADLEGLVMRIPGLGSQVMSKLGVTVQVLPGGEIFQALQTGAIDATEWVGPYDDTTMGFHEVTQFYYHPGWWEPGPSLEVMIPLPKWNALPEIYQEIVKTAAYEANSTMMALYDVRNPVALQEEIIDNPDITILQFPDDVMVAAEEASFEIFDESAAASADFASIFEEWKKFRTGIQAWHGLAETSYLEYVGRA
ncbi:MAG: TRAP transporter substrate-binding protein DctP [Actinobacteria bacterium]|jgi:TRAP-type mannitol/chloroaromatic compound transport system substrate-binding protein|nr:TRAP transporter substrate-binding protein DctP [Actinomycetota bacterium]MCZ6518557.1 TRAP transporter substrate-binding protein DctP [Actinomycetota bacterium]MCZ6567191.1 TRAP transporter substrate-binding protein DctP [Actinomycetota bacterium]MCZ6630038.1 TRAP transporter substrate-binding protein DctP [Actinomycetota bacterium]MCZ6736807.1 TRAP transporter substrate-binding protein DctP [Actinomycetota bacterium]